MAIRQAIKKDVVGWREWAALPDLGVRRIKVKVDTGARTSSLHASDYTVTGRAGRRRVRFKIYVDADRPRRFRWAEEDLVKMAVVKSSTGHATQRPVIRTPLKIGDHIWEIELNLVDRGDMGFAMLIGRQALKTRLLVDAGRSFLLGKRE